MQNPAKSIISQERTLQLSDRRSWGMQRDAQNQPTAAQALGARCLDSGSAYGSERDSSKSPSTQVDEVFQGANGTLYKFNPLSVGARQTSGTTFERTIHLSILCIAEILYPSAASPAQDPSPLRTRAGRTLVVGVGNTERMRFAQPKSYRAGSGNTPLQSSTAKLPIWQGELREHASRSLRVGRPEPLALHSSKCGANSFIKFSM